MKVKLSEIIDAVNFTDQNSEYFLDKETGEVVLVNDILMNDDEREEVCEKLDEHGFYRLPTTFEIDDYGTMVDFISTLPDSLGSQLSSAISGRGAFRRFKYEVRRLGLENQWYAYQDSAHKMLAIQWCEENGLEVEI